MLHRRKHGQNAVCRIPLASHEIVERSDRQIPAKLQDITWRIFRIMAEFVEGFEFLSESTREVSVFGSTRFHEDNHWYGEARKFGRLLADHGFTVITGGGPGIMEAANRGAFERGGESIGLNIHLPKEQRTNPFVRRSHNFHYFFTRKVMLAAAAQAYVFFPGGFGTLDELTELMVLIQTKKMQKIPIVLVGKDFWRPFLGWIRTSLESEWETISPGDVEICVLVDSAEEAFRLIRKAPDRSFF